MAVEAADAMLILTVTVIGCAICPPKFAAGGRDAAIKINVRANGY